MKRILIIIIAIYVFTGCAKKEDGTAVKNSMIQKSDTAQGNLKPVDVSKIKGEMIFDDAFKLQNSFTLEETKNSSVGMLWKIKITDDYIIINDLKNTMVFDKQGKYLRSIGRIGEGPGEFKAAECLDVKGSILVLYDTAMMRVTLYDINTGKYLKNWKVAKWFQDMCVINDKIIFLSRASLQQNEKETIYIYNYDGVMEREIALPESARKELRPFLAGGSFKLCRFKNDLLYVAADEFKIICFSIESGKILWSNDKNTLKAPASLPAVPDKEKWMIDNYPHLRSLMSFNDQLVVMFTKGYFSVYSGTGDYLGKIKMKPGFFFVAEKEHLYEFVFPNPDKNSTSQNPKVNVYSVAQ